MADVSSPKVKGLTLGEVASAAVSTSQSAAVVDLRLVKMRRARSQQPEPKYDLLLSSLVANASANRNLVTCESDPDLIDAIALVLAIPKVAHAGDSQDQEITAPIAELSGCKYYRQYIIQCCVFYSVHDERQVVELQAVFRDSPFGTGPSRGKLNSIELLYTNLLSDRVFRQSSRHTTRGFVGALLLLIVGILIYAQSSFWIREIEHYASAPPLASTATGSLVSDVHKGIAARIQRTRIAKSEACGRQQACDDFETRWNALNVKNTPSWEQNIAGVRGLAPKRNHKKARGHLETQITDPQDGQLTYDPAEEMNYPALDSRRVVLPAALAKFTIGER